MGHHCPRPHGALTRPGRVELGGHLSDWIAVEVVNQLLARGLLRSRFFGSRHSRSGWPFFTLFSFVGIGLLCGFLSCHFLNRYRFRGVALLLVLVLVVAGHETC